MEGMDTNYRVTTQWAGESGDRVNGYSKRDARAYVREVARFWHAEGHTVRVTRQYGTDVMACIYDFPSAGAVTGVLILTVKAEEWEMR